jgi:hypothetical protein
MTILWSIVSAVIASLITTLLFSFFVHRMTENAKKPWMTTHHQTIIKLLSSPNVVARVQLPNGGDQNYEVVMIPGNYRIGLDGGLETFDEMVEHKIVLPVSDQHYRLSRNYQEKYRKYVLMLAYEEFGIRWVVRSLKRVSPFRKRSSAGSIWG